MNSDVEILLNAIEHLFGAVFSELVKDLRLKECVDIIQDLFSK